MYVGVPFLVAVGVAFLVVVGVAFLVCEFGWLTIGGTGWPCLVSFLSFCGDYGGSGG